MGQGGFDHGQGQQREAGGGGGAGSLEVPACQGPRCCRRWCRWQCSSPNSAGSAQGLHMTWQDSINAFNLQYSLWAWGS